MMNRDSRWIDLSLPIEESLSEKINVAIEYFDHTFGAKQMGEIFGIEPSNLPEKLGWAGELVSLITHAGTHMDAPYHYGPHSAGAPAITIDQVPLEKCSGPGVVLDMRHKKDGEEITVSDLERSISAINRPLQEGDVVLIMTGADKYWGSPDYSEKGCGMGRDSTLWLANQGIDVIGIDTWGFDRPFSVMKEEFRKSGNVESIWPAHYAGKEKPYLQLEKLANLDQLPSHGFRVYCFPIKITRASAGWCRAVAEI